MYGDCVDCSWWDGVFCRNPDGDYLEEVGPYDGCTLCDHDAGSDTPGSVV